MPDIPLNIKLDQDALRGILHEAILSQITSEQREALILHAIEHLTTAPKDSYGRSSGVTPLQQAFDNAVRILVNQMATELIEENPELRAKIKEMIHAATDQALSASSLQYALSEILQRGLEKAASER